MSARQPFLPSRPASRALNPGDNANAASGGTVARAALPTPSTDTSDSAELGKNARALNISSFKKLAPRTSSFGSTSAPAEYETAQHQNPSHTAGGGPRSAAKGAAGRIYAPHPSTPPVVPGFSTAAEFKTPSLPFARSAEESSRVPNNLNAHTSPSADVANLFRPKSRQLLSSESGGGGQTRRPPPSSEQSFFGSAKFPFDSSSSGGGGDLDDSGYFSEQADAEADRFGPVKAHTGDARNGTHMDTHFVNSTKRARPASPSYDGEQDVVTQQSNRPRDSDPPKRPCIRRSPSRSRAPLSRASSMIENAPDEGAPSFALPPHIPHPTAAMGELPGLEFSEADLARYVELYEQGSERWSKAPMEEWVAGADDILAKFGEMIDMIKDHMSAKMNLYKSLHTRLSDEHATLDHRAKELRDASQSLVRDSGTIGGALH
ncbi:hypothetical protein EI94DRAFT_1812715 [Lactarius quietus]|nr:hypothetical protein EI94DRAFT_1812715 [Lactarius quietus]